MGRRVCGGAKGSHPRTGGAVLDVLIVAVEQFRAG